MGSKISRRVFLKGCAGCAVFGLMKPAEGSASCLPAGISGCRDENLRYAWYYIQKGNLEKAERFLQRAMVPQGDKAEGASINVEPVYVIAMAKYEALGGERAPGIRQHMDSALERNNPALHAFNSGFMRLFNRHLHYNDAPEDEGAEALLSLSLFTAVDQAPEKGRSRTKKYMGSTLDKKKKLLGKLFQTYRSLGEDSGLDRQSRDPANPYNRLLVGAHASKWLGDHYAFAAGFRAGDLTRMSDFVYERIEKPFRGLASGLKARNRCKYFNNRV